MRHRLTHTLVGIVTVVLVAATVAFSLAVTADRRAGAVSPVVRMAVPRVPHPTRGTMTACTHCHVAGSDGVQGSHATYGSTTCLTCHRLAPVRRITLGVADGRPAPLPHPTAKPYDDCTGCHALAGNLGMPEDHGDFAGESCMGCHTGSAGAGEGGAGAR